MCIINTTFGFTFVHVPKSAGTSVTAVLSRLCSVLDIEIGGSPFGEEIQNAYLKRYGLNKHATAREIRSVLGEGVWLKMTSFGVVRHPVDRLSSAYRFLRKWDGPGNKLREQLNEFASFSDFVASDLWVEQEGPDRMFRPQAFWLADPTRGDLLVDRVCRVETLDADLHQLLSDLGVKPDLLPTSVPQLNATEKKGAAVELSPELLEKVRTRYARDFTMFDYE